MIGRFRVAGLSRLTTDQLSSRLAERSVLSAPLADIARVQLAASTSRKEWLRAPPVYAMPLQNRIDRLE